MAVNPDADAQEAIDAILADLYDRFGSGTVFLPIPSRQKGPRTTGWNSQTFEGTQTLPYQNKIRWAIQNGNLGVLLGPHSGNLVTIDCDKDEYAEEFLADNPWAKDTIRTIGAHGCQFWFRIQGDYPMERLIIRNDTAIDEKTGLEKSVPSIEFRGGGGLQSVIYGLHKDTGASYQRIGNKILHIPYSQISPWVGKYLTRDKTDVDEIIDSVPDELSGDYEETLGRLFPTVDFESLDIVRLAKLCHLRPRESDQKGKWRILCPWRGEHSTETGRYDTIVFQAEKHEWPNFHCSHAHCQHRKIGDFLKWAERQRSGIVKACAEPIPLPIRFLRKSLIDYEEQPIDHTKTLLADRWLCVGAGIFVVAPTGVGKSTLTCQCCIDWGLGRPSFGIKPPRPLVSLLLQSEDDEGDLTEMAGMINIMKITRSERELLRERTFVERVVLSDGSFISALPAYLEEYKPDILWINPYQSFAPPLMDEGLNNTFLRHKLAPLLLKYNCGCLIPHHTPKTNSKDNHKKDWDFTAYSYSGAGWAVMSNWARGVLAIEPVAGNHNWFRFIAAKRGERVGWEDGQRARFFKHYHEGDSYMWVPLEEEEEREAESKQALKRAEVGPPAKKYTVDVIMEHLPNEGLKAQEWCAAVSKATGMSRRTFFNYVKEAVLEGKVVDQGSKYLPRVKKSKL